MKFSFGSTFLLFALLSSSNLLAQENPSPVAETKVEAVKDSPDYMLLGEFKGKVQSDNGEEQTFALQVRPIGKDRFEGLGFFGGLPGEDGFLPEQIPMIGKRHEQYVVLSGSPWAIFAKQDQCILLNMEGNKVGTLERVIRTSPTLGSKPPADGIVLFDGTNTDQFVNGQMTEDGLLMRGTEVRMLLQDFDLHVEFWLPFMPASAGQQRGNSGIYVLSRYECQILDSFAQDLLFDGCGALYRYKSPDLNMCLPPLTWQTYDVRFTAPRWASDGSKLRDARVSIWLNGVKVQDDVALPDKTGHGAKEEVLLLPIKLQDHSDPVFFRNVWAIDRGISGTLEFPIKATPEQQAALKESEKPAIDAAPTLEAKPENPSAETESTPETSETAN